MTWIATLWDEHPWMILWYTACLTVLLLGQLLFGWA